MGRKKRPAASLTTGPPPGVAQQPYGSYYPPQQPHSAHNLPPPLPPGPPSTSSNNNNNNNNKKQKTNESYPVKKYRPSSSSYKAIEAFQRYTKTHRMTDASFTLISPPNRGATPSCPIVFSIIINGQSLSWGRGKNKDVAIDNACKAAFALVAAHGYDYELNDDCLTTEPMEVLNTALPPPPPPPPMMAGLPPMGLPPPPIGLQPPLPPTQPSAAAVLIPQPKAMDATLASASSVSGISTNHNNMNHNGTGVVGGNHNIIDGKKNITLSLENQNQHSSSLTSGITPIFKKKKIKDGLMLIYDAEQEIIDESGSGEKKIVVIRSMEEQRSISDRYSKVMSLCWEKRRNDLQTNVV